MFISCLAQVSKATKCYTGQVIDGQESLERRIKQVDCEPDKDHCGIISIAYKMPGAASESNITQANCTKKEFNCDTCLVAKERVPSISKCEVSFITLWGLALFSYYNVWKINLSVKGSFK